MPRSPEPTRSNLLGAASRLFAERGVYNVSLAEIVREANQKNVSALHYHFGGRQELLEAVLARHIHPIGRRRLELVEIARATPPDDLRAPVAALVLPVTELAQQGQQQLEYLHIGVELATGPERDLPGLVTLFHETNGMLVRDLLQERLPEIPARFLEERFHIASMLTGRAASDRARMLEADPGASMTDDEFTSNLIDMIVGALSSPLGTKGRSV
jgi:AcrR family transcriptional regulator